MPKYDAFGREIGEDTLEGLGGTPKRTPRPVEPPRPAVPRPEPSGPPGDVPGPEAPRADAPGPEAPRAAVPRPEAPVMPDAAARRALAAQLHDAMTQAAAARPPSGLVVKRSTGGRGCLVAFALIVAMAGLAVAGGVLLVGGAIESGTDALKDAARGPAVPKPSAAAPRGLGPRSLARKANFAAALRKLRGSELRLTSLHLAPGRIGATLLTSGGRLRNVQVQPGGAVERLGPDSGPGFDSTRTIPFARLRPGAPERLVRQGAAKLHVPVASLQYLVPTLFSGKVTWAAYFKRSRYVIGDAAGRWQRSYP